MQLKQQIAAGGPAWRFIAHALRYSAFMSRLSREAVAIPPPLEILNPQGDPRFLVICDHASNALPPEYGSLGLRPEEFRRHIAFDIGAAGVARGIARQLTCPAVLTRYSRLLIDVNRGADDPTIVMQLSDGVIIPGNRQVDPFNDPSEFEKRRHEFYEPYHFAITERLDHALEHGILPIILSLHSFTPLWRGKTRSWHAGVLWDRDDRLAAHFLKGIRQLDGELIVGDNEPYSGALKNDCLYRHGTQRGLPHVLLEIRQDLIADEAGQALWASRCAGLLQAAILKPGMSAIRHYGSNAH